SPQLYLYSGITISVIAVIGLLQSKKIYFSFKFIISFLIGCTGWAVIYMIYFVLPAGVMHMISFYDFGYIFSNNLVFYSTTPMGIFVSGNYLYIALAEFIKDPALLVQTVINIRLASILPTVVVGIFGIISAISARRRPQEFHFDEISDEYAEMIPEHVRERLIARKCGMIMDDLKEAHQSFN